MDDKAEYEKIRAAALEYLFSGPDPEARETVKTFLLHLDSKINDAAAADRQIEGVIEKLRAASTSMAGERKTIFVRIGDAMQSPPFYFIFGGLMLVATFVSTEARYNSSLTFLVAMLGLAIMLYGTGSQAAGTFGMGTTSASSLLRQPKEVAKIDVDAAIAGGEPQSPGNVALPRISPPMNVAIAGGAAVLSAFFGWSVLNYAQGIRQVFRDDDLYTIVKVELCDKSVSTCRDPRVTAQTREELYKTSLVPVQAMDQLSNDAYLETTFGHRAYARKDGRNLEFVVFDRDLSDGDDLRIMAKTVYDNKTYSVDESLFDLKKARECEANELPEQASSGQVCENGVIKTNKDVRDSERVRRLVLRAPVAPEANEYAVQGGTIEDRRPANPIAPL